MSLKQPVNQVRLTNVAVVRLKRRGKRFELACYKNKVVSWRDGTETDLDEVLQTHSVFTNVSKGVLAKTSDLKNAFGTADTDAIVLEILKRGELQVSERERAVHADNLFQEIATIISQTCVDASSKRPFSVGLIERAMRDSLHYAVIPNKSAKAQAQAVVRMLQSQGLMDISRAQMRLQLSVPQGIAKSIKEKIGTLIHTWESETWDSDFEAVVLIDPGSFGPLDEMLRELSKGQATFEVLSLAVVEDNDEQLA